MKLIGRIIKSKKIRKIRKKINLFITRNITRNVITKDDLVKDLRTTGLRPGDKVMVHSSMASIGTLEEGAKTFVDALKEYITEDGIIVMLGFAVGRMKDYLQNYSDLWDVRTTPSTNGAITECFRYSENAIRSLHPTHSLTFWGKDAKSFAQGHENCITPFNEHSPFKKIIENNFKIMFVGLDTYSLTICRCGDDTISNYPFDPYNRDKVYEVNIKNYKGSLVKVKTMAHDPAKSKLRNNTILFPYLKNNILVGKLGNTHTLVLEANDVYEMQKKLALEGISTYTNDAQLIERIKSEYDEFLAMKKIN